MSPRVFGLGCLHPLPDRNVLPLCVTAILSLIHKTLTMKLPGQRPLDLELVSAFINQPCV